MPPPCLPLRNLSPLVGIQVQVFICIWCLSPFLSRQPTVCFDWDGNQCGGSSLVQPYPRAKGLRIGQKPCDGACEPRAYGNRRLTVAALCLSCFVKAANLPFVAADRSDKQERKWRIFRDGNKIRSWGRAFSLGIGFLAWGSVLLTHTYHPLRTWERVYL